VAVAEKVVYVCRCVCVHYASFTTISVSVFVSVIL